MGKVQFGGITKDVCLAYVPEAKIGDYVLVHVGFALSVIDEEEAREIFSYIEQIEELSEPDHGGPLVAPAPAESEPERAP
jgi:hydrogenase expression/formation protein HypC